MQLVVSNDVAEWYKKELELQPNSFIRLFPRYGFGGHIPGFAIGINLDNPNDIFTSKEIENLTFYIEKRDAWYFDAIDLEIKLNKTLDEPEFVVHEHN